MEVGAISAALAARFNAAAITPPTGYNEPVTATHRLPNAITTTPIALVFPPQIDLSYSGHKRSGDLEYTVRWYIAPVADKPRAADALYAWYDILVEQLEDSFDLDQTSNGVTHAIVTGARAGPAEYGDKEYVTVELDVTVHIEQGFNPST